MRISAIVPTYNNPDYLRRVLEGFSVQSRPPDELIVADDGSGPETADCVSSFARGAGFPVRHVWQEDEGYRLARIRNLAVKAATGDYLVIVDGDAIPDRHFVSDHALLARPGCFVQGKRVMVSREASASLTQSDINSAARKLRILLGRGFGNSHHLLRLPWLPPIKKGTALRGIKGCNMAYFRSDILAVNGYNEAFRGWGREDSEFAVRLYKYGLRRIEHPFMAICYHLWHPAGKREALEANEELLEQARRGSSFWCADGIEKSGEQGI